MGDDGAREDRENGDEVGPRGDKGDEGEVRE